MLAKNKINRDKIDNGDKSYIIKNLILCYLYKTISMDMLSESGRICNSAMHLKTARFSDLYK